MGRTAVLLIAHGSRNPAANRDLEGLAARLTAEGAYPIVEACFLELAEPDITTGVSRCVARGATRILMIPYFLSLGIHLIRDLTMARSEAAELHRGIEVRLAAPLGPDALLETLVKRRIEEADKSGE